MAKRLLGESLVVVGTTLICLLLGATVGISTSTRSPAPTVAADEQKIVSEGRSAKQSRFWIGNHLDDSEK
jgi:hypothetical protein